MKKLKNAGSIKICFKTTNTTMFYFQTTVDSLVLTGLKWHNICTVNDYIDLIHSFIDLKSERKTSITSFFLYFAVHIMFLSWFPAFKTIQHYSTNQVVQLYSTVSKSTALLWLRVQIQSRLSKFTALLFIEPANNFTLNWSSVQL